MNRTPGRRSSKRFDVIPDVTASFVTFLDLARGRTWTVPVIGWDLEAGKPVVLDLGTARLERVEVLDEARDRAACVWSGSTICGGSPMTEQRAQSMLRGLDGDGPFPLRVV